MTWLDPHQIDVYSVGAWHLAYNFTDSQSRADRRYLLPAIKFLEEGVQNNPNLWDLYFEEGFTMYYWKKSDYAKSVYWLNEATKRNPAYYVYTQLSHAYERNGQIDKAIEQWKKCIAITNAALKKNPNDARAWQIREVSSATSTSRSFRRCRPGGESQASTSMSTSTPQFKRLGPRKFRISGRINLPDGARVEMSLIDADYKEPDLRTFSWQVDPKVTMVYDGGINGI